MRALAAGLVVVVAIVIAGSRFVWHSKSDDDASRVHAVPSPKVESPPATPANVEAHRAVDKTSTESELAPAGSTSAIENPGRGDALLVSGSIVVTDDQGVEHRAANGSFNTVYWSGASRTIGAIVRVVDGRFSFGAPTHCGVTVDLLELDGRFAFTQLGRFQPVPGTPIELRATWGRSVLLHVVDRRTRRELRGVTLLTSDDFRFLGATHPGSIASSTGAAASRVVDSPIDVAASSDGHHVRWEPTLFATAPGYAWDSARADHRAGGEVTIALLPACSLEVTVIGEAPPPPTRTTPLAMLRLRQVVDDPLAESAEPAAQLSDEMQEAEKNHRIEPAVPIEAGRSEEQLLGALVQARERQARRAARGPLLAEIEPDSDGSTSIPGLAPGRCVVALERGNHWEQPQVLASAVVELAEGDAARVTLVIEPSLADRRVPLAGTVRFDDSWVASGDVKQLRLVFEPLELADGGAFDPIALDLADRGDPRDLVPMPEASDLYRFDLGLIAPGRYVVQSYEHGFRQEIDTGPSGLETAQIVIGDPADVVVLALDDRTGEPIRAQRLLVWSCGPFAPSARAAAWSETSQAWCFRAPAGRVELALAPEVAAEYESLSPSSILLHPGRNDLTVKLVGATGVVLSPEVEGVAIEWPLGCAASITLSCVGNGFADQAPNEAGDRSVTVRVPAPGRWRVTLPPVPGFEPVAPFELQLERGVMLRRSIALRPKR